MNLAFCLFNYFPYGGLQRDMLRIAAECQRRGHKVAVYTMAWEGEIPEFLQVTIVPVTGISNHRRCLSFAARLPQYLQAHDLLVGFNKIPGLDVYYAADPCYVARMQASRSFLYRLTARYRAYAALEKAVFDPLHNTTVFLLSAREQANFQRYYATPSERFQVLPPGIARDRCVTGDVRAERATFRANLNLQSDDAMVLLIGSRFKTKGVDRALYAMQALPSSLQQKTHLFIVGDDDPKIFSGLAKRLGVASHVHFMGARNDVPQFLLSADILLHPAYTENTGTVLLEALAAGLPVLTTATCGYAPHIERANAGVVLPLPFQQTVLDQTLCSMLLSRECAQWGQNALHYAATTDLYSLPVRAVELLEQLEQAKIHVV